MNDEDLLAVEKELDRLCIDLGALEILAINGYDFMEDSDFLEETMGAGVFSPNRYRIVEKLSALERFLTVRDKGVLGRCLTKLNGFPAFGEAGKSAGVQRVVVESAGPLDREAAYDFADLPVLGDAIEMVRALRADVSDA